MLCRAVLCCAVLCQALSRRGCHASALEVTKLLLALDPEDPVGGLLLLDYLALRAGGWKQQVVLPFDCKLQNIGHRSSDPSLLSNVIRRR